MSTDDFTEYVEASWARMFRTAYALTGEVTAAEDLLQRTLVKAFVHWKKLARAESPDSYLRRMMVNESTSTWRSKRSRREVFTETPPEQTTEFESLLATRDELWQGVCHLPPRQRAVVVLRYYEDLSEREIAEALGVSPGSVKSMASAALANLRGRLQPVDNVEQS